MSISTRKTVAWSVMVFIVALWIFVVFFFDGILSRLAEERLESVVATATHGEYQLNFANFQLHRGTLDATGMDMRRIAYRANEHGTTLRDLGITSVRVTGIRWWEILFGKPIELWMLRTNEPRVYLCDFSQDRAAWKLLPPYTPAASPISNVLISFDSVLIPGVWSYGQVGNYGHSTDRPDGVLSFSCQNVAYDSKSKAPLELAYKDFQLHVPWIEYHDSDAAYSVRNLNAMSHDSMLSIDRFAIELGSTRVSGSGVWANKIGIVRLVSGRGVSAGRFQAQSWALALSSGTGKSRPQPAGLPWQDKLARSANFPIKIDTLLLGRGALDLNFKPASNFRANGLDLRAYNVNFDTGAVSDRPGYARVFDVATGDAQYAAPHANFTAVDFRGRIEDSDISSGTLTYGGHSGLNSGKPMRVDRMSTTGIRFRELLAGTEISAYALRARGWNVSEFPSSSGTKSSKHTSSTIWAAQSNIAKSVAIPVRFGRIDLTDGRVHVTGSKSPTILADRAAIDVVNFDMDSTRQASKRLLFSNDVSVGAGTLHFADVGKRNIVDLRHARTHLNGRSVYAATASYTTRSTFEPDLNHTTYSTKNLDLTGIDFAGLLDSKRIALGGIRVSSWQIDRSADTITQPPSGPVTAPAPKSTQATWKERIAIARAELPNGTVIFRERDTTASGFSEVLNSNVKSLDVTRFRFLPPKGKRPRLGFDQILFVMPSFTYTPLDGFYSAVVRNMNANFKDSLITMDSLNYEPRYSEAEFAKLHKYARGRTDFRLAPVNIYGIDARRLINGGGVDIEKVISPNLWVDYYKDSRVPADPHPGPAVMPNQTVRSLHIPFTVDLIVLEKGHIQIREHTQPNVPPGNFTFDSVNLAAGPITFDTANPLVDTPTHFLLGGYLLGQAPAKVSLVYPLHDSSLNLAVKAQVGPFNLTGLNQYLVNANRIEVKSGNFYTADVTMDVKDNAATTFVKPIYNHFKIKILDTEPGTPGLGHRLETFAANTFVLRDDNPDEDGGAPVTATTTLSRDSSEEFFQFMWFAIRKSLGTVVGGFK